MDSLLDQLREFSPPALPGDLPRLLGAITMAVLGLVFLVGFYVSRVRRRGPRGLSPLVNTGVDVASLPMQPPASDGMQLEVYGTPVRIAVIVLAPVGRDGIVPAPAEVTELVGQLVPGFADVALRDQPLVRVWETQLSSRGFANAFSSRVPLPGNRGKGSPWCSVMGKFTAGGRPYLIGVVGYGQNDNALSQYSVQHEGQWNDILRVRREAS